MFVHIGCRNVRWTRHSFWAIQIMYIPFNTSDTWTHLMEKIWQIVDFKKHLWYLNTFERKDLAFQNSRLDQFEDTLRIHYDAFLTKFYFVHFTFSSCTLLHTTATSCTVKIIFANDGRWQLALFISQFYTDRDAKYINYKHSRINLSRQMFPLWRHLMWLVGRVILFLTSWYVSLGYTSTIQSNVLPTISNLSSNFLFIAKWQKLEGKEFLLQNNLSFGFSPFYSWSLIGLIDIVNWSGQ